MLTIKNGLSIYPTQESRKKQQQDKSKGKWKKANVEKIAKNNKR